MTDRTRSELVTRALQKLVVIGSGQSPEDEDSELMDSFVQAMADDLAGRSVVYVGNLEAIPSAIFEWLAVCLAETGAEDFGKEQNPQKRLFAERMLRQLSVSTNSQDTVRTVYY